MTYYGGPATPLQPSPAVPQPTPDSKPQSSPSSALPLKPLIAPPGLSPSTRTAIATPPRQWQYKPVIFATGPRTLAQLPPLSPPSSR